VPYLSKTTSKEFDFLHKSYRTTVDRTTMTFQWFQYGGYIDFRVIQLENDIDNPQILFQKIISLGKYNYKFFVGLHGD
jgi:hypothetical protein